MTTRHSSATVISAYRATSVVDTPMRKVEVLESADGRVIFRATEFSPGNSRADVHLIYLEHHEAVTLARVVMNLEDQPAVSRGAFDRTPVSSNGNGGAAA